jgi:hypothetical protein
MAVRIESQAEPIPGYRLIERIGGGGFGEVWKAEAPGGLHKAIKFVYGDLQTVDDDDSVRAEQELKAMRRVQTVRHPYILSLERYDIVEGQLIIVMELADKNLWDRFRECRSQGLPGIPREELLRYLEETSEALDLMNKEYQLQHLDIKPQNLFLVHNHIKVADFGLVKDLEGMVASVTGGVTPVYAAPETFDGWISRFCDQYSLAIVYQELLTGQRPFSGSNVRQLILQHLQGLPDLNPLPVTDREAIRKALSKNPEDRHPNCVALVKALRDSERAAAEGDGVTGRRGDALTGNGTSSVTPSPGRPVTPSPSEPATRVIRGPEEGARAGGEISEDARTQPSPTVATPGPGSGAGDGVLFPALVIGLGDAGLRILRRTCATLAERFGSLAALPQLRFLYLDTDPEAVRQATAEADGAPLRRSEVLLAPLHRPSHYLKAQAKTRLDTWFDLKMLYRIPRSACSAGLRALGRLAFADNYRVIAQRLREELRECTRPQTLAEAARQTGLGMRMDRPRVYVVTSLAGGTGSGMFLDLAYAVRSLLRQLGYEHPEVVGVLLLPGLAEGGAARPGAGAAVAAAGNAYAALAELSHFSNRGTTFTAAFDVGEAQVTGPLHDPEAPFQRCVLLPLPERGGGAAGERRRGQAEEEDAERRTVVGTGALSGTPRPRRGSTENGSPQGGRRGSAEGAAPPPTLDLISHFLVTDLTTSLGRSADMIRRDLCAKGGGTGDGAGLFFQTLGMHRLVWPRRELLAQVGRRLCHRLVQRWMDKDARPVRDKVQTWVQEQWVSQELSAESLIDHLHRGSVKALGKPAESAIAALIEPVGQPAAPAGKPPAPVNPDTVAEALAGLDRLLGKPQEKDTFIPAVGGNEAAGRGLARAAPGALEEAQRDLTLSLIGRSGQRLAELVVCLIEQPAFRLAGAEEAIRQLSGLIEQSLQHHEHMGKDCAQRASSAYEGLLSLVQALREAAPGKAAPRKGAPSPVELLRAYAKGRYQTLILQHVCAVFVALRGQLSDQMQEVGFCRNRLSELCRSFAPEAEERHGRTEERASFGFFSATGESRSANPGLGQYLLPVGLNTLEEAVKHYHDSAPETALQNLDQRIEAVIRQQFTALVHVCLTAKNLLKNLGAAMQHEAELILGERLTGTNVVDMYLRRQKEAGADPNHYAEEIARAFDRARPQLGGLVAEVRRAPPAGMYLFAAPTEPAAASGCPRFRDLVRLALPDQQVMVADALQGAGADEILFYREEACLRFADLKLLGPAGRAAYLQLSKVEHFTPHSRTDISAWLLSEE